MHFSIANSTDDIIFCNLVLTNDTYVTLFETHLHIPHFYSNIPLEILRCTSQGSRYSELHILTLQTPIFHSTLAPMSFR